jgi:WhiB family redox-sensing transcriptional regulator
MHTLQTCEQLRCHAPGGLAATMTHHTCLCDDAAPGHDLIDLEEVFVAIGDADWMDQALCAQVDPEAFFPDKGGSTRQAKQVCMSCLVRAECLDWALDHGERFGIWGGLSERERRKLKNLDDVQPHQEATPGETDLPAAAAAVHHEKGTAA